MNEIQVIADTGLTLYALIISTVGDATTGQVWHGGNTFRAIDSTYLANAISIVEQAGTGIYLASFPATILLPGSFLVPVYQQAGSAPAIGDERFSVGSLDWDGAKLASVGINEGLISALNPLISAIAPGFSSAVATAFASALAPLTANITTLQHEMTTLQDEMTTLLSAVAALTLDIAAPLSAPPITSTGS